MKDWAWRIVIVSHGIMIFAGMVSCSNKAEDNRRRVLSRILRDHCQVTSFYGISGDKKIYTCNTGVYRDVDL